MVKYELTSIGIPKMHGQSLRAFALLLENRVTGSVVVGQLLRQGGVDKLREWVLTEPPTFLPLGPPPSPEEEAASASASTSTTEGGVDSPFCSAAEIAKAYRERRTDPVAVVESALAAITASDSGEMPLRAFIASDAADVRSQAEAARERWARGAPLSPLDGVPIAIKDEIHQAPYPTTAGTGFLRQPMHSDSTVVARLRAAGAVLLGKANMHEIGINPNGLNVHHGVARNPYDRSRDPGGSSSGSAAAVAAGLSPIAIGADGGGSIRIPAALCGLVGLKPTFGRVSEHGAQTICWTVTHLGPIATTVDDAELTYRVIAGPDPHDPNTLRQPPVGASTSASASDLRGVRLGVYRAWFDHADPAVVRANRLVLDKLCDAGAQVVDIEVPYLEEMRIAQAVTILSEMVAAMRSLGVKTTDFGPAVRVNLAVGRSFRADDYIRAQQVRTRAIRAFGDLFARVDVIMTPASAITAPPIPDNALPYGWSDLSVVTELMRYAVPANLTGIPSIAFPAGYSSDGLPIGAQAMANYWREDLLFRVARVAERAVVRRVPARYHRLLVSSRP